MSYHDHNEQTPTAARPLDDDGEAETQGLLQTTGGNGYASTPPREESLRSPGLFVWAVTVTAALSGLLFGYECVASCGYTT
jgi:hypothetical protein